MADKVSQGKITLAMDINTLRNELKAELTRRGGEGSV